MGQRIRPVTTIGTAIVKVFDLTVATTGWNEKRATAQGLSTFIIHTHPGSHAGYYPGAEQMALKLLVDKTSHLIVGAQAVGKDGVDKRIDVLATAVRAGMTAPELADLELAYAPPFGSAKDPVNMLGYIADNMIAGLTETAQWYEVEQLEQQGYVVVDVRTQAEFETQSIPGALNIPLDELRFRLDELAKLPVLVYCQVGQRGHSATVFLREEGFQAVNLDGGFQTWLAIKQDKQLATHREESYV
jgi:rhodanese-related sulfurtransferase